MIYDYVIDLNALICPRIAQNMINCKDIIQIWAEGQV